MSIVLVKRQRKSPDELDVEQPPHKVRRTWTMFAAKTRFSMLFYSGQDFRRWIKDWQPSPRDACPAFSTAEDRPSIRRKLNPCGDPIELRDDAVEPPSKIRKLSFMGSCKSMTASSRPMYRGLAFQPWIGQWKASLPETCPVYVTEKEQPYKRRRLNDKIDENTEKENKNYKNTEKSNKNEKKIEKRIKMKSKMKKIKILIVRHLLTKTTCLRMKAMV